MLNFYKRPLFVIFSALVIIFATIPISTYIYFAKDLESKDKIMNRNNTGVTLLDRNGIPFFTLFQAKNKIFVPISDIPQYVQKAAIASEDKEFYRHGGFSIRGIIRSLINNFKKGDIAYGGSTITQQLVKNALLNSNKSFLRKYQEIVLAQEIERRFNKQEILEMYLNSVYFGEGSFGIEEAAKTYFGKSAKDLTLSESSLLIGLLPAPSNLSPLSSNNPQKAFERQRIVLEKMVTLGYITKDDEKNAENEQLTFNSNNSELNTEAIHFAMMIRDNLVSQFGEENISRSGFVVKTTIDLTWQEYAQEVVRKQVLNLGPSGVSNGAAVVIDPKTGEVRALVGSKDWRDLEFGKVNVAISPRQPGSSFKPIVYVTAFTNRILTPASILHDQPTTFPINYSPKDYDGKFRGNVTVRRALSNSLNVPAVEAMSKIGVSSAIDTARALGITTLGDSSNYGLSLALGAGEVKLLELTNAYATFANSGVKNDITTILDIYDKYGNKVYENHQNPVQVLDPGATFLISSILSDNKARSEQFGDLLNISRTAAVKTGTSENYKDSLTLGYTPSIAIGVWVGNNDGTPMDNIAGSLGAAPIWKQLMEQFLSGTSVEQFIPPGGVVQAITCNSTGTNSKTPVSFGEYYLKGTEPISSCITPSLTPSVSPSISPTITPIPSTSLTPTVTPTPFPSPTLFPTVTPLPTNTPTQIPIQQ